MKTLKVETEASTFGTRFGDLKLFVDGSEKPAAKTPHKFNPCETDIYSTYSTFDMLKTEWKTGEYLTGRIFKLDWPIGGEVQNAEVKFLEIDYFYPKCEFQKMKFFI